MERSPPLSSEMICNCFPGGLAMISIPQLSGSFSSSRDRSARPPPKSSVNISRKLIRTWANVSPNNFLVVELICAITSSNSRRELVRSLFCASRNLYRKITTDRKSTRLNSSHVAISYAVFCLKKKKKKNILLLFDHNNPRKLFYRNGINRTFNPNHHTSKSTCSLSYSTHSATIVFDYTVDHAH